MEWAPLSILHCHGRCREKGYFSAFTVSAQNRLPILFLLCAVSLPSRCWRREPEQLEAHCEQFISINQIQLNLDSSVGSGHRKITLAAACQVHLNSFQLVDLMAGDGVHGENEGPSFACSGFTHLS